MACSVEKYSLILLGDDNRVVPYVHDAFQLGHRQEYKVGIFNHDIEKRIDAVVEIDRVYVGTFRVEPNDHILVERSGDDLKKRKLTFYAVDSEEGRLAGLQALNKKTGSIVVTISVEDIQRLTARCMLEGDGYDVVDGMGGTGLGAPSQQRFQRCSLLQAEPQKFVITARMSLKDKPVNIVVPL